MSIYDGFGVIDDILAGYVGIPSNDKLRDPMTDIVPMMGVTMPGKPENNINAIVNIENFVNGNKKNIETNYNSAKRYLTNPLDPTKSVPKFAIEAVGEINKRKQSKVIASQEHKSRFDSYEKVYSASMADVKKEWSGLEKSFNSVKLAFEKGV